MGPAPTKGAGMHKLTAVAARVALVAAVLALPTTASPIPAFARKYGTSCLTCHTVYPRLTPFGEAFRRNGYRFPGVDSDYVKQDTVALGQDANKKTFPKTAWPDSLPISIPIAIGFNGQAVWYPDKNASVPRANNGAQFVLDDLVSEGHVWAGAAFDDKTTVWAELTFGNDGTVDLEHAQLLLNDLLGPKHAFNLVIGKGFPTLTSFGPHSSFLADARLPNLPVTGIYVAGGNPISSDPFVLVDNYTGLEVNGVVAGYLDWSAGLNAGKNVGAGLRNTENWYAHVGYKLDGMRLDGEGAQGPADAMKPWAETALTLDVFGYHSREWFPDPVTTGATAGDTSWTAGVTARGQAGSTELDAGYYWQRHDHGNDVLARVDGGVAFAELSYVLFPWLVPAVRVEWLRLAPAGGSSASDLHVMPGVAAIIRPNIKLVLVANIESGNGFPADAAGNPLGWTGGSADWGPIVLAPKASSTPSSKLTELESVALFLAWAM